MKKSIITVALLVWGACALAQNLNPTVEVTNTYIREASGIEKPVLLLQMPDSVQRFNLDFDYAVRNTPYQGAYEFKPYLVQLRPMPRPSDEGTFYLNAGMGYRAHPELTLIWTPVKTEKFRLNLFADHYSYLGQYRKLRANTDAHLVEDTGERYNGKAMHTDAGANAVLGWSGGVLTADLRYRNIFGEDQGGICTNNLFQGQARLKSSPDAKFSYEVGTRVSALEMGDLGEFHTVSDASVNFRVGGIHHFGLTAGMESVGRDGDNAFDVALTPRYVLTAGRFLLNLGVKFSYIFASEHSTYKTKSDFVFPAVNVSFEAIPRALVLQAWATGGDNLNVYSRMVDANPFLYNFHAPGTGYDNSTERVNVGLGARGSIAGRFSYDVKAGYAYWKNALVWGYVADAYPAAFAYADPYHLFYVDVKAAWKNEFLEVDGNLTYKYTTLSMDTFFAPPALSGKLKAVYNWGNRIRAGVTLSGKTARESQTVVCPAFLDLGVLADFQMTRKLGLWVKSGNLLNQEVSDIPFHSEAGPWFTLGLRLHF